MRLWLTQGYLILYTPKPWQPTYCHRFGGRHQIKGAVCPNCQRPLTRYLELDTHDPRLHLQDLGIDRLPLLFCPHCLRHADIPIAYQMQGESQIRVVQHAVVSASPANLPEFYSERPASLLPMPGELQVLFQLFNRGFLIEEETEAIESLELDEEEIAGIATMLRRLIPTRLLDRWRQEMVEHRIFEDAVPEWKQEFYPQHQVGGEPLVVTGFKGHPWGTVVRCALCGNEIPFLACIGNDYVDTEVDSWKGGFHDGAWWGELLFHLCVGCRVVSGYYLERSEPEKFLRLRRA